MKKFKTKRRHGFIKLLVIFSVIVLSFLLVFSYLTSKIYHSINPEVYVKLLLSEGFNNQVDNYSLTNPLDLTEPLTLIQCALNFQYSDKKETSRETIEAINKSNDNSKDPLVYIYNTHDTEGYWVSETQPYNITPNVKFAAYILQEKLSDLGVKSIVETASIGDILTTYDWKYANSYNASRLLLDKAKENYPTLKYFIDIHRDSSKGEKTTLSYENNEYARIMFIVGLENTSYESNLMIASSLSDGLNGEVDNLSRGIYKKEGEGVNGVYNQDVSSNAMLIEVGGYENSIESVANSINIFGDILYKYIEGDLNEKGKL